MPCTSSGEPQSHTSVMDKELLQHHPGPSLVCPGSTKEGSPGCGWSRGCPAHPVAWAWACLCGDVHRNNNQGCLGLDRFNFQAGNTVRANYEEIFQQTHFSFKSWLCLSLLVAIEECGRAVWLTGLPLELRGAAHTGMAGTVGHLADTWQPVHNEFLPLWYFC